VLLLAVGVCSCSGPSPGSGVAAEATGGSGAGDPVVRAQAKPGGAQSQHLMGGGYRPVTRADGSMAYVSKLKNLASTVSQKLPGGPALAPPDEGLTVCPIRVVPASPETPPRWDLHAAFGAEDLLSPVHDQMARGNCTIFSETSALETEYIAAYGQHHSEAETQAFREQFNLSEQYLMDMAFLTVSVPLFVDGFWNNTPGPYDPPPAGTVATANLTSLNPTCGGTPLLGLPRIEDWPTARADATILYPMMQSVPMVVDGRAAVGPVDTHAFSSMLSLPQASPPAIFPDLLSAVGANGRPLGLNLDLANFGWSNTPGTMDPAHSVYPPSYVHEDARYAPSKWVSLQAYNANAQGTPQTLPSPCGNAHIWEYPIVTPFSPATADQVACYQALAAPFETTLSENHPIIFGTDVDAWNFDPFPLTFFEPPMTSPSYWTGGGDFTGTALLDCGDASSGNPNGCSGPYPLAGSGDHTILLIGYDDERQLFHIKNSWGTAWGTGQGSSGTGAPDGTAWMTYDLFFRTVVDPGFIDGVWDPTGAMATDNPVPEPIPNGAWFGFWQAELGGSLGVAVIGHYPQNTSLLDPNAGIAYGRPGDPYGTFYPMDGTTPTIFRLNAWGSAGGEYWADFEAMGPLPHQLFRLTQTFGAALPRVTWTDPSSPSSAPTTWSKCNGDNSLFESQLDTVPTWYTDVMFDPYVFPPCDGSTWHVDPAWTCPDGGDYLSEVQYQESALPGSGQENEVTRLCLVRAGAPECPFESPVGMPPPPQSIYEDVDQVNMNSAVEPDQFGDFEEGWAAMPSWVDVCAPTAQPSCLSQGDCALPSCPIQGTEGPFTRVPLLGANPGVWVRPGADVCVASAYAPTAVCPTGYVLSPNGTDCLLAPGR
jgi:hypothetical protein